MALAARTVQNIPDLQREPMTVLQPASMTPEPTEVLTAEFGVAHTRGVGFKEIVWKNPGKTSPCRSFAISCFSFPAN